MKKIYLIGNAHLDPAWMWQWQEGFAEIKATFRSALDRMKEFEDFKFVSACSLYYMWIEKSDKKMFDEIAERIKEGRWSVVGGQFIQPDCNAPSGESFARHSLVSQRYFKEKFGVIAHTGYNVDSFGHNANMPKILKNSGMSNYVFMRPMPHEKNLPQNLFIWESMDGSRVTTFRLPHFYNIDTSRFDEFYKIVDKDENYDIMGFFGVGNHGGGPTVELLDRMKRELGEEYIYATPDEYFEHIKNETLPTVKDDLQFHAKGCYSACSLIKADNRKSENKMLAAETYSVLSEYLIGTEYPSEDYKRAWGNILFNHFHDVMGGCSTREVCEDAETMYSEVFSVADKNINFALQQISWNIDTMDGKELKPYKRDGISSSSWKSEENIGTPIVIFNPLASPVKTVIAIKDSPKYVTDTQGNEIPIQKVINNPTVKYATAFLADIPAMGYSVYRMYFNGEPQKTHKSKLVCTDCSIENEFVRLEFNKESGELTSYYDKKNDMELLSQDTKTVFADESKCDTWAHDVKEFKEIIGIASKGSVKLIEDGPVRATVRSKINMFSTSIVRDYSLEADSKVVIVKTTIDFHEKQKMLKFSIPVNVENPKAYSEIPFGFIERPTDGSEQPCGEWIAMTDGKNGMGMASNAKYSFDADQNILTLTILRGATYADHTAVRDEFDEHMDQGINRFEYSLFPFDTFADCKHKAQQLNCKPFAIVETFHKGMLPTEFCAISVSAPNVIVTAIKKAEDGKGIVLRLYETENKDTNVHIKIFDNEFDASFTHNEVKTFLIKDGIVTETDFMEWSIK